MTPPGAIVFVVDDDPSMLRALARLLKTAGHDVETFASSAEFLARPAHDGPGCLVLDLKMPGLSGLDVQEPWRRARATCPSSSSAATAGSPPWSGR